MLAEFDPGVVDRFEALRAFLVALGGDAALLHRLQAHQELRLLGVRASTVKALIFVKVEPTLDILEPGFTRDVLRVGRFGTGDLEVTLTKPEDLERTKRLILRSYEAS